MSKVATTTAERVRGPADDDRVVFREAVAAERHALAFRGGHAPYAQECAMHALDSERVALLDALAETHFAALRKRAPGCGPGCVPECGPGCAQEQFREEVMAALIAVAWDGFWLGLTRP